MGDRSKILRRAHSRHTAFDGRSAGGLLREPPAGDRLRDLPHQPFGISDEEVEDVADFIKHNAEAEYDEGIMDEINRQAAIAGSTKKNSAAGGDDGEEPGDEMFPNAVEVVLDAKMASTTLLQRKLKLGYARAARLMDELESKGIIGPFEGSKPRQVLITKQQWMEKCALSDAPADDET